MSPRRWIVRLALVLAACTCLVAGCGEAMAPKQQAKESAQRPDPPRPAPVETPAEAPEPVSPSPAGSAESQLPPVIEPAVRQVEPDLLPTPVLPELPSVDPIQRPLWPPQPAETSIPEVRSAPGPDGETPPPSFPTPPRLDELVIGKGAGIEPFPPPEPTDSPPPDLLNPLRPSAGTILETTEPEFTQPRIMTARPPEVAIDPGREGPMEVLRGPASMPHAGTVDASPLIYDPPIVMREGEPLGVVARAGEPLDLESLPVPETTAAMPEPAMPLPGAAPPSESPAEPLEVTTPILAPADPAASDAAVPDEAPAAPAPSTAPAPPSPAPTSPGVAREEGDYAVVQVFYGTDRAVNEAPDDRPLFAGWPKWTAGCAGVTLILLAFAVRRSAGRTARGLAVLGVAATVVLGLLTGYAALYDVIPGWKTEKPHLAYGLERGRGVELGTCEVSIPKEHQVGVLESPSIFKLEVRETPERHVVLLDVERLPEETFYTALSERVARSPAKDAFVFVHGYNVSFEDAARRTAQIAYDLDFPGAPIFYSWPSQASLTGYTVDETNVEWTVPHLREFLVALVERTGAEHVHLVAHSMGNRAVAGALRGLSYRRDVKQPMFNHVVLTAPDIDADVFRRDLAPRIVKTAERVTLYASSNDKALSYSKTVHGYPRAGDTGDYLVVVPGIDTIDVSAVDTSLFSLGHLYYGSNQTVLADLFDLIRKAKPPEQRRWLRPELLGSLKYWVFERIEAARAAGAVPR